MTIFYPDISSHQSGIDLAGCVAVAVKATEGTGYTNPDFWRAKKNAASHGTFFMAYHFLHAGSAVSQARHAHSVAGSSPLMLDFEPSTDRPSMADANTFIDEYRRIGGTIHLVYLPHWYWQQIGSPSLQSFINRDMHLVSSNYTTYSDGGPGWASYGGMTPKVWQYTSTFRLHGFTVDMNAFKGSGGSVSQTVAELKRLASTGRMTARRYAVNPVKGLKATPRYTQADLTWNRAPGAKAYRIVVKRWLRVIARSEVPAGDKPTTTMTFHGLKSNTKYRVSVVAAPMSPWANLHRSSVRFTTK